MEIAPGSITYMDASEESFATSREPTAGLRWSRNGVLQQRWQIITYKFGQPWRQHFEWADVPTGEGGSSA